MGHAIQGVVMPMAIARTVAVEHAVSILLQAAGLAFIPMTDALFDQLAARFPNAAGEASAEFWKLSSSGTVWIEQLSATGRVAYIETEYFGGAGCQAAAVWESGRIILEPQQADIGPIDDALRLLGITRTETQDEFDVAGLARYRATEDWLRG